MKNLIYFLKKIPIFCQSFIEASVFFLMRDFCKIKVDEFEELHREIFGYICKVKIPKLINTKRYKF